MYETVRQGNERHSECIREVSKIKDVDVCCDHLSGTKQHFQVTFKRRERKKERKETKQKEKNRTKEKNKRKNRNYVSV